MLFLTSILVRGIGFRYPKRRQKTIFISFSSSFQVRRNHLSLHTMERTNASSIFTTLLLDWSQ